MVSNSTPLLKDIFIKVINITSFKALLGGFSRGSSLQLSQGPIWDQMGMYYSMFGDWVAKARNHKCYEPKLFLLIITELQ